MKISYAITVCNELNEFTHLIEFLLAHKRPVDEIVVLQDTKKYTQVEDEIFKWVNFLVSEKKIAEFVHGPFREDFAEWKNSLGALCTGDYIFQIDADECPNENMMKYLPALLEQNPNVDLFLVSRENIVNGLTQEDVDRWHWNISKRSSDGAPLVNWPDWQTRIYRKGLQWEGKVHERIVGYKQYAKVPTTLFLEHTKNIEKQREQNDHYNRILQNGK